jgi:hypothetical protein
VGKDASRLHCQATASRQAPTLPVTCVEYFRLRGTKEAFDLLLLSFDRCVLAGPRYHHVRGKAPSLARGRQVDGSPRKQWGIICDQIRLRKLRLPSSISVMGNIRDNSRHQHARTQRPHLTQYSMLQVAGCRLQVQAHRIVDPCGAEIFDLGQFNPCNGRQDLDWSLDRRGVMLSWQLAR